jgi:hypothetical protein
MISLSVFLSLGRELKFKAHFYLSSEPIHVDLTLSLHHCLFVIDIRIDQDMFDPFAPRAKKAMTIVIGSAGFKPTTVQK